MHVTLRKSFSLDDLDKYRAHGVVSQEGALGREKMSRAIGREFQGADHSPDYINSEIAGDEVVVTAELEFTDTQWLFENTEGWKESIHSVKHEDVYLPAIRARSHGVLLRGTVNVTLNEDAPDEEAKTEARHTLKNSFSDVSDLDLGRVIESGRHREVQFVLTLDYGSPLITDIERTQARMLSPSEDWERFEVAEA